MSNPSGDSTITGLPSALTLTGAEWLVMDQVQNGIPTTVRVSASQLVSQSLGVSGTIGQVLTITGAGVATFSNSPTIIGGTINNTPIGSTTRNTGSFTTVSANAGLTVTAGGISVTGGMTLTGGISADTLALSNPLQVSSGGTGRTTLTNHAVLVGAATGAITQLGTGTSGQSLISQGAGADPVFGQPTGTLINIQRITTTQTYTPTAGTNSVLIHLVGGGGGGGGGAATGAGQAACAGGGGGGGTCIHRMTSGFSGVTVTIGAAGSAGAAGNNNGGAGGTSTFGAILSAGGGGGGGGAPAAAPPVAVGGGSPGTATGGNIANVDGSRGGGAMSAGVNSMMSFAGVSLYSTPQTSINGGSGANAGFAGSGFGGGGSGAAITQSQSAAAGGAGSAGVCIIYEYA